MKKVTLTAAVAGLTLMAGSVSAFAWGDEARYKDLYEIKELHVAFHKAVSHAGISTATQANALDELLALWTDDGVIVASNGVTYTGKGTPGTASCELGALTICDFYSHHAGGLTLGHDWVSLTPIFTESVTLLDRDNADLYFQCIYLDATSNAVMSNVTYGLPGMPGSGRVKRVHGHWLFSYTEIASFAPPTLDVDE
ncbi:MAG TPA: hypothetical protein VME42_07570 [Steroidobacteraceae bacterium]|nr:hypothetical protein [Steroidobacteraceae bacterium]